MVTRRSLLKFSLYSAFSPTASLLNGCNDQMKNTFNHDLQNLRNSHPHIADYLARVKSRSAKPNILLMVLDDAGWGDLGAYGNRLAQTKNIDRLANEGVKFQVFQSGSPVCAPSRVCLFTGRNPAKLGINTNPNYKNLKAKLNGANYLKRDTPNLMSVFKNSGYNTGFFGKAHFGGGDAPSLLERGADRFFGWSSTETDQAEYRRWVKYTGKEKWPAPMTSVYKNGKDDEIRLIDEKTTAEALKFMQSSDSPWFVQLNFNTPHTPLDPRPEDREAITKGKPYWSRSDEKLWGPDQMYYGALKSLDERCISPLLQWLDDTGKREDTIVILTSDNGAMRPHNPSEAIWSTGFNGGYSGWKAQLDLGATRVPCIFSWPGVFATNAVTKQVGYFADFLPTLAFLANVKLPNSADLDGENIAHALVSPVVLNRKAPIYYYYPKIAANELQNRTPTLSMLTPDGAWYFQCDAATLLHNKPYRPALYYIPDDPGQTNNLYNAIDSSDAGKMSRKLSVMLLAWADEYLPDDWEKNRTRGLEAKVYLQKSTKERWPLKSE